MTYVFIGVIPVVLLVAMAFITIYLFAGQFANFVVTSELDSRLRSLQSVNAAIAHELAAHLEHGQPATAESLEGLEAARSGMGVTPDLCLERRNASRRVQRRHAGKNSICASRLLLNLKFRGDRARPRPALFAGRQPKSAPSRKS